LKKAQKYGSWAHLNKLRLNKSSLFINECDGMNSIKEKWAHSHSATFV